MISSIKNILVYVDYSKRSLNAVNSAIEMARRHNAALHLVQVLDKQYVFPVAGMQAPVLSISHEIVQSEIENLHNYAISIQQEHGINCVSHHEAGPIISSICGRAVQIQCDVLVVGTDHAEGEQNFLVDSMEYKLLKSSPCPVLTIPGKCQARYFKRIVFPVRPVLNAMDKFSITRLLVKRNKASLHMVGALKENDTSRFIMVKKLMGKMEEKLHKEKVPYSYEMSIGKDIADCVLDLGKKLSADLIVITASTRRNFKEFFLGNYAQRIIGNANTPVLCVKPMDYFLDDDDNGKYVPNYALAY